MPKVKVNEGIINLKVPGELKSKIKMQALKEQTTMQNLILRIIKDYYQRKEDFIEIEAYSYEELTPEEKILIERGRQEFARGEYQEFDDMVREIDNESNSH
jgi:hypothetical protein